MEFVVEDRTGAVAYLKFGAVDEHTSPEAARVRTEIFKSFLINAGVSNFESPQVAAKEAIGNFIEVCLCEREWWTVDKETDRPVIKTRVEYKFSGKTGRPLLFKESYLIKNVDGVPGGVISTKTIKIINSQKFQQKEG
jgi:hypothetical protein